MSLDVTIASASDANFFPFLQGLILSIRCSRTIGDVRVCVLDVGLERQMIAWLEDQDVCVIRIDWDFGIPDQASMPEIMKAQFWRPFLPKYLPRSEIYLWLDADAWVQDEQAVLVAVDCARQGAMVAVPELNRFYKNCRRPPEEFRALEKSIYRDCFGEETASRLIGVPLINSGVFACARDSDSWSLWGDAIREMSRYTRTFFIDQCSLNYAIYMGQMPFLPLPAYCNWICCQALPYFDEERGKFIEPGPPAQDLWIVHMASSTKYGDQPLLTRDGTRIKRSLAFAYRDTVEGLPPQCDGVSSAAAQQPSDR